MSLPHVALAGLMNQSQTKTRNYETQDKLFLEAEPQAFIHRVLVTF